MTLKITIYVTETVGFTQQSYCKIQDFCLSQVELSQINDHRNGYMMCKDSGSGNCVSNSYNSYRCDCFNNVSLYWDYRQFKCVKKPNCLSISCSDPMTQLCVEDTRDGPKCKCIFNERVQYYDENEGKGEPKCVPLDYCNPKHQLLLPTIYRNPDPCGTGKDNTKCLSRKLQYDLIGSKWIIDYICVCKPGYQTIMDDNHKTTCKSHLCDLSAANKCDQKCMNDDNNADGYTCGCDLMYDRIDNYKCQLKSTEKCDCNQTAWCGSDGKCQCKRGFKIDDNTGKTCILLTMPVDKSVCLNGKTKLMNNEIVCDCPSKGYTVVNGMCKPIDVCADGQEGQQVCAAKNATCILNARQPDQYECQCLPGMYTKFSIYEKDRTVCVDYCLYEKRNDICKTIDAICDPTVKPKLNEQIIDFCVCKPGNKWAYDSNFMHCEPVDKTVNFTVNIRDVNVFLNQSYPSPIDGYSDVYDYIDILNKEMIRNTEIERSKSGFYYKELVKSDILSFMRLAINSTSFRPDNYRQNPVDVTIYSCYYNRSTDYYKCVFVLSLDRSVMDNKPSQLVEEIKKLCFVDQTNKLCFFPTLMGPPLPPPSPITIQLVLNYCV
ncbi:fibrillin-2-like [Oppia nitens]|uniref:fibrillin-2-like n=1 Tax=Oppia nitens TaxID=1686743 RepID=UPI0023DA127B|nr:fibrillin-2-like [Oppia nitens]